MKKLLLAAVVLTSLILAGCGTTKIGRILNDPMRYANRNVRVEGTVTNVVGAFVAGVYQVQDDTGKIYVLSTGRGTPGKGVRIRVDGNVTQGVNVMGRSFGTTIRETNHKVRY
ncbi:MAG TPA: hypothetical protein VMZ52_12530 [Bryobacteraceae bacterium]|nr:hypothetical protein [Bryobacteraceae bacterium]